MRPRFIPRLFLSFSIRSSLLLAMAMGTAIGTANAATPAVLVRPGTEVRWSTAVGRGYQVQRWLAVLWTNQCQAWAGDRAVQSAAVADGGSASSYRMLKTIPSQPIYLNALANGGFEQGTVASSTNWTTTGTRAPHSPTPIPILAVPGAAGAKAIS